MVKYRPTLFIASSSEAVDIAGALHSALADDAQVTVWDQGVFGLSKSIFEELLKASREFDFAVVVMTADDLILKRGKTVGGARDNTVFELGLFMGALGRERTFVVRCQSDQLELPTDLLGLTTAVVKQRTGGNLDAAVGTAASDIRKAIIAQKGPPSGRDEPLLSRAKMYMLMKDELSSVTNGETILLTSFQAGHPLRETDAEIRDWHAALAERLRADGDHLTVRRLVSVQTLAKLVWVEELMEEFGDHGIAFNLRVYPSTLSWRTGERIQPLPLQVQVLGQTAFVGGVRERKEQPISDVRAVRISARANQFELLKSHHAALWAFADPTAPIDANCGLTGFGDLLKNGRKDLGALSQLKWDVCSSWLIHYAGKVATPEDFEKYIEKLKPVLSISDWYKSRLKGGTVCDTYRRHVLTSDGPVEIMLAEWRHGDECWPHDHGGAFGYMFVLRGTARVVDREFSGKQLRTNTQPRTLVQGDRSFIDSKVVHSTSCAGDEPLVTLHIYYYSHLRPQKFLLFDLENGRYTRRPPGPAWAPPESEDVRWHDVEIR